MKIPGIRVVVVGIASLMAASAQAELNILSQTISRNAFAEMNGTSSSYNPGIVVVSSGTQPWTASATRSFGLGNEAFGAATMTTIVEEGEITFASGETPFAARYNLADDYVAAAGVMGLMTTRFTVTEETEITLTLTTSIFDAGLSGGAGSYAIYQLGHWTSESSVVNDITLMQTDLGPDTLTANFTLLPGVEYLLQAQFDARADSNADVPSTYLSGSASMTYAVPEPSTWALLGLGAAAVLAVRRRVRS